MHEALVPFGAAPVADDFDDPTDTFTFDLRDLRARERDAEGARGRSTALSPAPDVRGLVVSEALRVVEQRATEALCRRLRQAVGGEPDDALWYPEGVLGVLEAGDEAFGTGDRRLLAEVGRAVARRLSRERAFPRPVTPELLFARVPDLWGRCFADGQASVREQGLGYGLLEVSGHPRPRLSRAVLMMGLVVEALELAGGRRCEVRLAEAAALGDRRDLYEACWST